MDSLSLAVPAALWRWRTTRFRRNVAADCQPIRLPEDAVNRGGVGCSRAGSRAKRRAHRFASAPLLDAPRGSGASCAPGTLERVRKSPLLRLSGERAAGAPGRDGLGAGGRPYLDDCTRSISESESQPATS